MSTQRRTERCRIRELGIRIGRLPTGRFNAITDVPDVRVGHLTLVEGSGPLKPGRGPVRTGVTAIIPHGGNLFRERVMAAIAVLNGSGEVTGRAFVDEMGELDSPIFLTNSFNVPIVADAAISYMIRRVPDLGINGGYVHPVVAECSDMMLNDIQGRHIRPEHVWKALESASSGPVQEGCVGGGTGLVCYQFKSGIGTASRLCTTGGRSYTVGVLAMPNHGLRHQLRVDGVPVGELVSTEVPPWLQEGSVVLVVATDAPLTPRQLDRLAKRAMLGLARTGATARNGSGDMVIAFSTGNRLEREHPVHALRFLNNLVLDPLFEAVVEATEEAILNALTMAESMTGRDGRTVSALPLDELVRIMRAHGRLPAG